jgi:hypothetical protein
MAALTTGPHLRKRFGRLADITLLSDVNQLVDLRFKIRKTRGKLIPLLP